MQSPAYAQKIKISNLQKMANTIIYVEENGFDTQTYLKSTLSSEKEKLSDIEKQVEALSLNMKSINEQIHFTGQYLSSKRIYTEFLKSNNKQLFRQKHLEQIQAYEEARAKLKDFYPNGKYLQLKDLKEQKSIVQNQVDELKAELKYHRDYCRDLETADVNVSAILGMKIPEKHKSHETEL